MSVAPKPLQGEADQLRKSVCHNSTGGEGGAVTLLATGRNNDPRHDSEVDCRPTTQENVRATFAAASLSEDSVLSSVKACTYSPPL